MGSSNNVSKNAKWYVVHTYSGYENKNHISMQSVQTEKLQHHEKQEE